MSFPQLGYPQYLSAAGPGAYGGERPGVLAAAAAAAAAASSGRPGATELGSGAGAAAVTSVLGMYAAAGPYAGAPNYSAFLPYAADLSLFSQMVSAPACSGLAPASRSPGRGGGSSAGGAAGEARERPSPGGPWRRGLGSAERPPAGLPRSRHSAWEAGGPAAQGFSGGAGRPQEQARGARPVLQAGTKLPAPQLGRGGEAADGAAAAGAVYRDSPARPAASLASP